MYPLIPQYKRLFIGWKDAYTVELANHMCATSIPTMNDDTINVNSVMWLNKRCTPLIFFIFIPFYINRPPAYDMEVNVRNGKLGYMFYGICNYTVYLSEGIILRSISIIIVLVMLIYFGIVYVSGIVFYVDKS